MKRTCTIRVPDNCRFVKLRAEPLWHQSSYKHHDDPIRRHWSDRLQLAKQKLDIEPYHSQWKHFKEYTNKYERVFSPNHNRNGDTSVALYTPVSRSYFKLWEMIIDFRLFENVSQSVPIQTAHLAEGPGGFIEAVCNYRKQTAASSTVSNQDKYYGMTLIDKMNNDVPNWNKAIRLIHNFPQIQLHNGIDNTGNLYKIENIQALVHKAGEQSCDLVTGDGGIDYSKNYNKQEELSHRLLVAQVYAGMLLVKPYKHFICKLFDTNALFTKQVLWLLSVHFDTVHLVKPLTSRVANSERYVVACGFRGLSESTRKYLRELLDGWDENRCISSIMSNSLPSKFTHALHEYNEWHSEQQCISLQKCYQLIDDSILHKCKHSTLKQIMQQQDAFARGWCHKYNIRTKVK